jgi:acetylornithine deacetylase/succinyl-diaminopimelate desuccinylase-like protein
MDVSRELVTTGLVRALAEARGVRECLAFFTREKTWIHEQHVALCRVPAPTFLEEKRARWMEEQFRAFGCEAEIDRAGNVVAWPFASREEPLIAVTAHLDTVLVPRRDEDITLDGEGRLCGPGVSDNGAGLAALLALARALRSAPPLEETAAGLVLVANVGEEGEGNLSGMRYLTRQSPLAARIRAYLVLDGPALDHITTEALASRRFEIVFTGPGGHSWSDRTNPNPVHALSHAIAWFTDDFEPAAEAGSPRSAFNFGTIEGGSTINSIPALARAKVDLRSEDGARIEELVRALAGTVERAAELENLRATGGRLTARLKEIGSRPAGRLPGDASILEFLRAVDNHLGIRARLECASTDANIPLSLGIPALSIGTGGQGGGAHTAQEWYLPEGRDLGLKRILLTLALLLKAPPALTATMKIEPESFPPFTR